MQAFPDDKEMGEKWKQGHILFSQAGSKITVASDCSHEIKRCLLFETKAITNRDRGLKSRDITLLTKVRVVKAMVFQSSCMDLRVEP